MIQFIHILICFHWHMVHHQLCIIIIIIISSFLSIRCQDGLGVIKKYIPLLRLSFNFLEMGSCYWEQKRSLNCHSSITCLVLQYSYLNWLSGESVPVTKTPIPNNKLSSGPDTLFIMTEHSRHVLFCGTHVIQTRYYGNQRVRAVVIRTGELPYDGSIQCGFDYFKI